MLTCVHVKCDHLSSSHERHNSTHSLVKRLSAFLSLFLFVTTHGTHTETLLLSDYNVFQCSTLFCLLATLQTLQADTPNQYKAQTSYNMVLLKCLLNGFIKHKDT